MNIQILARLQGENKYTASSVTSTNSVFPSEISGKFLFLLETLRCKRKQLSTPVGFLGDQMFIHAVS